MRVVALISGGKDSCFNMMQCVAAGHDLIALANLYPIGKDDLDSLTFQTVGHQGIEAIAEAVGLPLYREPTHGKSKVQDKTYEPIDDEDEVEDLYRLLKKVKESEKIEAVSTGAIASDYQRLRVENVCERLGLASLAYLWQRDQEELLIEMINCSVNAILIKVSCMGLDLNDLGKSLSEMRPHLFKMKEKFGMNVCGEGGEYETFTLDCPLFSKRIVIKEVETVVNSGNDIAPVGFLNFKKLELLEKEVGNLSFTERLQNFTFIQPDHYIREILSYGPDDSDSSAMSLDDKDSKSPVDNDQFYSSIFKCNENESLMRIRGITSKLPDPGNAMEEILEKLREYLSDKKMTLSDLVSVSLFIRDMGNFAAINNVYRGKFRLSPPVRLCVQCPLKDHVLLEAVVHKTGSAAKDGMIYSRQTVHVQSISHWAPANVGPYSQAVRIDDMIFLAGQIPLIPGTMEMLGSSIKRQCCLILRHCARLLKSIDDKVELSDIVQGLCFLTDSRYIAEAREEWEKATKDAVADYVIVPDLPRGAKLEWSVWAHRKNSKFVYWERTETIGNITISTKARCNLTNISAIVGHLSLDTERKNKSQQEGQEYFTDDAILECFEFVRQNLLHGYMNFRADPACTFRIFYKTKFSKSLSHKFSLYYTYLGTVVTCIPVLGLINDETFVSILGICHN